MVLPKLAISNFRTHKIRMALTVAAIAMSISLVVSVTSGYASVFEAILQFVNQYLGATDALITRQGDQRPGVPQYLLDELRRDPDAQEALGRLELLSPLHDVQGRKISSRAAHIIGIDRPRDRQVESLNMIHGQWFNTFSGDVAVIDQVAARLLKDPKNFAEDAPSLAVGDFFNLPGIRGPLKLQIAGIVRKPAILAAQMQTVYVPLQTLQAFAMPAQQPSLTRIMIQFKPNIDPDAFVIRWQQRLAQYDPALKLRLTRDNRKELDQKLTGLDMLSYLGGTVAMLAATFIVFSTLSMGVSERQRALAMLRAVGAFRSQLAALVVLEGLLLALAGVVIGLPLGWLWVKILSLQFPDFFAAGAVLSLGGAAFAVLGSLAAALLASFLPALSAMRLSPLQAMSPLASSTKYRPSLRTTILGILLILIDPCILLGPLDCLFARTFITDPQAPYQALRATKFYGHIIVGLPGIMIGFFLLAPLFVWLVEWVLGPIVSAMFRLRFALLRQQLTAGIWRAAGTCAALMVGLAVLVVMQVQGRSALEGWKIPDKFPDIFIFSHLSGLDHQEQQKLAAVKGIKPGQLMPIAIASPEFSSNVLAIVGLSAMPGSTLFFGIDPDLGLKMMDLDFRDDDGRSVSQDQQKRLCQRATELLKTGRHIVITEELRRLRGLKVGDPFPLKITTGQTVNYIVAGIVWSPGLDVVQSVFDMSQQIEQRTAFSVFGTIQDAQGDFGVDRIYLFAANLESGVNKEKLLADVKRQVGKWGLQAGDVREIKFKIQTTFRRILLLLSTVAFAALAVASLGVTNTIMASIRSRRWQFGILRSVGVTRGQLLRIVLAEAVLLGLVGAALGLAAGAEMILNARSLSTAILGYTPPLYVPWGIIGIGMAVVMTISIAASLLPALNVARAEPLHLLQAGRGSD